MTKTKQAALNALNVRMPEIFDTLKMLITRPIGEDDISEIRSLVEEVANLAANAQMRSKAYPLVYLADDVARGVSPRKALCRYIEVAETLFAEPTTVGERRVRDAWLAVEQFKLRSSVFC